jgi:hypothetical protein
VPWPMAGVGTLRPQQRYLALCHTQRTVAVAAGVPAGGGGRRASYAVRARVADPDPAVTAAIPARQAARRSWPARARRRYQIPRGIGRSIPRAPPRRRCWSEVLIWINQNCDAGSARPIYDAASSSVRKPRRGKHARASRPPYTAALRCAAIRTAQLRAVESDNARVQAGASDNCAAHGGEQ